MASVEAGGALTGERNARSLGSVYGRLYGPIAVAAVLIASQPLIEPDVSGASTAVLRIEPLGEEGADGSGSGVGYVRHHSPGLTGAGSAAPALSLLAAGLAAAHAPRLRRLARAVAPR